MSTEKYAVVELYQGEYHQGFKSREEAEKYVHKRLDEIQMPLEQNYGFRVVLVLNEWDSQDLLPNERY